MRKIDLKGQRFGRWLVLSEHTDVELTKINHSKFWLCRCDCGNEKIVGTGGLRRGGSNSCGCLAIELSKQRYTVHGMRKTAEYRTWTRIKNRCYNKRDKKYPDYGGRGITVCDRWLHSFENFLADMGKRPLEKTSIERINNDKDYEPSNCKWATPFEQGRNRRSVRHLEYNGEVKIMADWARYFGISNSDLHYRLKKCNDNLSAAIKRYGLCN